jgi:hypothetical protein
VGTFSWTATAIDKAGNSVSQSGTYKVVYKFDGFLQPINDTAHQVGTSTSVFKAGSTIPVKFQLRDASSTVVQAGSLPLFSVSALQKCADGTVDESVSTATPDTSPTYRWDSTAQQYVYNYKSPSGASGMCQFIQATLDDGTTQSVYIGYR